MRIALVLDEGKTPQERVTAARNWKPILSALTRNGIGGRLITLGPAPELEDVAGLAGWLTTCVSTSRSALPMKLMGVRRETSREQIDLVHAHEVIPTIVAALLVRPPAAPIVFHRHHTYSSPRHAVVSRVAARLSDHTLCVSQAAAQAAERDDRTPRERILVAHNGVDAPAEVSSTELADLRRRLNIQLGSPVITCVGRMRPEKGHHLAIQMLSRIKERFGNAHLVLVGDGPSREELEGLSSLEPTIHFVGHQTNVAPWLRLADVILLPSLREAFPLTVLEAMAAGRAVVATHVGGVPELIDGANGMLVGPGDPDALAEGVSQLLEDPARRSVLAQAAYETYVRNFTVDAMVSRWIDAYRTTLLGKR